MSKFVRQKWVLYTLVGVSLTAILATVVLLINPRLLPNSDIYTLEGDSRGLFANSNPNFDVLFGNKEDESAQWIRFESETKDSNIFNPNYQPEKENIFQKVSKIFKKEEKLGIEMSLSGVKLSETSNETVEDISKGELRVEDILGTDEIETSTELYEVGRSLGELDNEQIVSKETIVNENVWKGVDLEYQILEGVGLKEEIIIRDLESYMAGCEESETGCDIPLNEFIFDLHLDSGVELHRSLVGVKDNPVGTYYFTDSKGNYLAHFLPSFAFDEGGSKTTGVELEVKETDIQGSYKVHVTLNIQWMLDPSRVYPIHIDPSIVHDDTSDFSTGIFSRLESATGPKIQLVEQELVADEYTVGLWHMNEGSGTSVADSSGNGNTGTASGTTVTTGMFDNARSFNGSSDYIQIANSGDFDSTTHTWETWFKPEFEPSVPSYNPCLFALRNSTQTRMSIHLNKDYSQLIFWNGSSSVRVDYPFQKSSWYHFAYIFVSNSINVYINGMFVGSVSLTLGSTTNLPFMIGSSTGSAEWFDGILDEVRISNIARTPEEIKASAQKRPYGIFTSSTIDLTTDVTSIDDLQWTESGVSTGDGETPYSTTNMVGQWDFNETSGTTADNEGSCGASCDGTLTNMTTTGQDDGIGTGWTANNSKWGGGALMFDGSNDYVNYGFHTIGPSLNGASVVSVEYWLNIRQSPSTGNIYQILGVLNGGGTSVDSKILDTGKVTFGGRSISTDSMQSVSSVSDLEIGQWNYVVGVFDYSSDTITIYINGKLDQAGSVSFNSTSYIDSAYGNTSYTDQVGNFYGESRYFTGELDSVKVYSRALSATEILSNYNSTNIEFLTRTSADGSTWEDWKPTTSETQIESLDGDGDFPTCTGGTKSGDIYSFTTSGTFSCPSSVTVDVLVVGGGGSGGSHVTTNTGTGAGGGGAGGVEFTQDYSVTGSTNITVTVGSGGTAPTTGSQGTDGGSSVFGTISVTGGGGGGYRSGGGRNGGSGGGGGYNSAGGTGVSGEGHNGGSGSGDNYGGAGGGGAGAVGTNSSSNNGQPGGAGSYYGDTFGTSYGASGWFGGGGGGGAHDSYSGGSGGTGGGGAGGVNANGTSATDGTGGGGGGSGDQGYKGGDGGNGIVLIKIKKAVSLIENSDTISVSEESNIKKEGTKSLKIQSGILEVDSNTVGLWHMDETGGPEEDLTVNSAGYSDGNFVNFTINDDYYTNSNFGYHRGIFVITYTNVNSHTLNVFDTWLSTDESDALVTFLNGLSNGTRVLMGVKDEASRFLTTAAKTAITNLGSTQINSLANRDSWAFIAVKGQGKFGEQRVASEGGSASASVVLKKIFDSSGNSRDGILKGSTIVDSKFGKARSFNGSSDYASVACGSSGFCDVASNNFSISGWVKTSDSGAMIVDASRSGGGDRWYLGISSGKPVFHIDPGGATNPTITGSSTINDGEWHHLAGTRTGVRASNLYVDGVLVANTSDVGGANSGIDIDTAMYIGSSTTLSDYLNGYIDEIYFSNTARSADEIYESYRVGREEHIYTTISSENVSSSSKLQYDIASDRPGTYVQSTIGESAYSNYLSDSNTVGLWHLEEETGGSTYIKDSSGNGNDGSYISLTNLSLNKTSSMDSTYSSSYPASNCNDGNTGTMCHNNSTSGGWWKVDLGDIYSVNRIVVYNRSSYQSRSAGFKLEISCTGSFGGEQAVLYQAGGSEYPGTPSTYDFSPTNGRYVRFYIPAGTDKYLNIMEITVYGGEMVSSTEGKFGKAMSFNGSSDYIDLSNDSSLDVSSTDAITLEAWIYPTGDPSDDRGTIVTKNGSYFFQHYVNDTLTVYTYHDGGDSSYFYSNSTVQRNEWNYVAFTENSSGYRKLYINGELDAGGQYESSIKTATGNVSIGGEKSTTPRRFFEGAIDEVRISDIARTATEIRQAYEIGKRTHPITIDFGASLDSTNLITGSGDTSFTIDATTKGMSEKGSGLYVGDKVIVKENYGGTEYIAQGTVATVNETTGAVTVSSWDSGGTYPASGYTQYADVFKWQKEYIDVGNIRSDDINAVTNIAFKILDGYEGRNIWIDDISRSTYLTDSGGTSNVTSTVNRYIQYMAVVTTSDTNVTPYISNVTINYTANTGPSMEQVMRHGKWFNSSGEKQNFWWANTE